MKTKKQELSFLKSLGKSGAKWSGYETFPRPEHCTRVTCVSDEVTAVCPITGQADWYQLTIEYVPRDKCVESKSLKLAIGEVRNQGHFCEQLADKFCRELFEALEPFSIKVTVVQRPRGGVSIHATSVLPKGYVPALTGVVEVPAS